MGALVFILSVFSDAIHLNADTSSWFPAPAIKGIEKSLAIPLDTNALKDELSNSLGHSPADRPYPRQIIYTLDIHDFHHKVFATKQQSIEIQKKPSRIVPHSVGISEILWAICPRDKLVAFQEFAGNPRFSFISGLLNSQFPLFSTKDTEKILGFRPDLVFTVFYSESDFKEKLKQAGIQYVDLGYFGSLDSIEYQIRLIGQIIGEEGNAEALIEKITDYHTELKAKIPSAEPKVRILHYGQGGYVTGARTTFNAVCQMIGCINVAAEKGVTSLSQIDYETLLKWDPDVIILPVEHRLKDRLMSLKILSFSKAVGNKMLFEIPSIYLNASSQYIMVTANLLAGMIYGGSAGQ
jgi:iron complex transport system substrate-binding protein